MRERGSEQPQSYGRNLLRFFVPLLLLVQFSAFLGATYWPFDLLAHMQGQFFLAGLLLLLIAAASRELTFAGLSMLSLGVSSFALFPLYVQSLPSEAPKQTFRIVSLNVLTANTDYARAAEYLKSANADIVYLVEVNAAWLKGLEAVAADYPFRFADPREDNFGAALFSRFPLEGAESKRFGGSVTPSIFTKIRLPQAVVQFVGVHTLPPMSSGATLMRNRFFVSLFEFAKHASEPVLVSGDFNSTRWGYPLRHLLQGATLKDSSEGFGYRPTWFGGRQSEWLMDLGILGIPIDTVLYSRHFVALDRAVGPPVGSDHRGVTVTFGWLPSPEPAR